LRGSVLASLSLLRLEQALVLASPLAIAYVRRQPQPQQEQGPPSFSVVFAQGLLVATLPLVLGGVSVAPPPQQRQAFLEPCSQGLALALGPPSFDFRAAAVVVEATGAPMVVAAVQTSGIAAVAAAAAMDDPQRIRAAELVAESPCGSSFVPLTAAAPSPSDSSVRCCS
jgi:hypothetical protein